MTQEHAESQLRMMQKFKNFWSNVGRLSISKNVSPETNAAIVRGMEKAYGKEEQGREAE